MRELKTCPHKNLYTNVHGSRVHRSHRGGSSSNVHQLMMEKRMLDIHQTEPCLSLFERL